MRQEAVFLGLGSNVGNRRETLQRALGAIVSLPATNIVHCSSIYESEPVGYAEQPDFLNMVVQISTTLTPERMLDQAHRIEQDFGRVRGFRWGPRPLDIDILYWGERVLNSESLVIPHPQVQNRRFVLQPLAEIAPGFVVPPGSQKVEDLLDRCQATGAVEMVLPRKEIWYQAR
ncbi:MAG: 2-amino-4-hydroxy-6-hydroxymethyldihydropteridine diphosphokinase [bacterium]